MTTRDETFASGAAARRRSAEARAARAAERRHEAEREADAEIRPDLAELRRHEAELHARAERLQQQAADIQRRHTLEHEDR